MLASGRPTILERGVARVTWSISEFYTPLNFSGMDENRLGKFCAQVDREVLILWWQNVPRWAWSRSRDVLIFLAKVLISRKWCKIEIYLQWKTNRKSYMAYQMAATALTLNDFRRLQAFSNAIRGTFMQHFTRIQLTVCRRSMYVSWTSRMNRETTDKR